MVAQESEGAKDHDCDMMFNLLIICEEKSKRVRGERRTGRSLVNMPHSLDTLSNIYIASATFYYFFK